MPNPKAGNNKKAGPSVNDATVVARPFAANDVTMLAPSAAPSAYDATVLAPSSAPPAVKVPTTIFFSLAVRQNNGTKLTWNSDLPVVQMLSDLVSASRSITATDSEGLLTATVPGPIEAVILAVRARKLSETFCCHATDDLRGISIGILAAPKSGDSPESALRAYLGSRAQSWQVFLAGDAYKLLDTLPGLQFRKLPAPTGPRLELHELVLPPVTQATKPVTASIPVTAPVPPKASQTPRPIVAPIQPPAAKVTDIPLNHRKDEDSSSGSNLKFIIGGVAAALVLGVVLFLHPWSHSASPAEPATGATPAATTPAAGSTAATPPAAPTRRTAAEIKQEKKDKKAEEAAAAAANKALPNAPTPQPSALAKVAQSPPPPPPEKEKPIRAGGGYTAEQLKAILDKADSLTANGKYDDAIRNYRVVLASDPSNSRARAGLERANTNKSLP